MKAADLHRASVIVGELARIAKDRAAVDAGLLSAGVRCNDGSSTWVNFPPEVALPLVLKSLDMREAEQRRLAAQIGLVL